jgi:4-diphosphocytidyl-2-C-methyl-D-erythritol kinase
MQDAGYNPPHPPLNKGGNKGGYHESWIMHRESLRIKTPAKINLGLEVKGLRPDGYHEIETIMQMVGLFDELRLEVKKEGIDLITLGKVVIPSEGNMVYKAFMLFNREVKGCGVRVRLKKNIPVAAGLGGGSSDGAATLVGLDKLYGTGLKREDLIDLGRRLGSDVPFFLCGPSALARGRGEILTPVRPLNSWVLLINPDFPVSTSWVYRDYDKLEVRSTIHASKTLRFAQGDILAVCHSDPESSSGEESRPENRLLTKGIDSIKLPPPHKSANRYINDLERVTIKRYPEIERIKESLIDSGAELALMSGSGPTVFGIFSEERLAKEASKRFRGYRVFVVKTLTKSPYTKHQ